ncbi:MAG TPA: glucosamine-6-phosphate deaminase [Oligoflexia bacterium]|nr:glucosamine-6-phosphate deaminase [Oligoflexia bacterium]
MEVVIQQDPDKVCKYAAQVVAEQLSRKPASVLGLAAGSSQLGLYRELIRMHKEDGLDFSKVNTFNLDEYAGLPPEHPCSYHTVMSRNFFDYINIPRANIHIPDGMSDDIPAECQRYEAAMRELGGIDLEMLGVGADGHIGFNEPSSSLGSRTRLKMLTEKTRYDNSRFFASFDEVPRHVITMGVGTIMDSRMVMLIAFGKQKADVVSKLIEGPVTAMVPASVIQFHPRAKVIIDEAAAQKLKLKQYYKWAFEQKPKWQGL